MKKVKVFFLVLLVLTALVGLWRKNPVNMRKYEATEFLFDTECTVRAYGIKAEEAVKAVFRELAELHTLTSIYDKNSQISLINSANAETAVCVDSAIVNMINKAQQVCRDSEGAFDITAAPVTRLWKFDGDKGVVPSNADIQDALDKIGFENFEIDVLKCTVKKKTKDASIDLGGVVKGYAGDVAAEILKSFGVDGALVDLGGNIVCVGKNQQTKNGAWRVGLQKPFAPTGEFDDVIEVESGAVVTSGTYQRFFEHKGRRYHHIIDPHSGYPSEQPYDSVTVVTDSALTADCLSTACFVLGEEKGRELAKRYNAEVHFLSR